MSFFERLKGSITMEILPESKPDLINQKEKALNNKVKKVATETKLQNTCSKQNTIKDKTFSPINTRYHPPFPISFCFFSRIPLFVY